MTFLPRARQTEGAAVAYWLPSTAPAAAACARSSRLYRSAWDVEPAGAGREDGVKEALTCGGSTQHRFGQEQESEVVANPAHGPETLCQLSAQGGAESARCPQTVTPPVPAEK